MTLITKLAHIYRQPGIEVDDLIQEGYLGLLEAKKRFSPEKGAQFTTYAVWWIKKYMKLFLVKEFKHQKLPRHIKANIDTIPLEDNELLASEGEFDQLTTDLLTLGVQDLLLVLLRFGLGATDPMSYERVGDYFGKSREWARLEVKRVLGELR